MLLYGLLQVHLNLSLRHRVCYLSPHYFVMGLMNDKQNTPFAVLTLHHLVHYI